MKRTVTRYFFGIILSGLIFAGCGGPAPSPAPAPAPAPKADAPKPEAGTPALPPAPVAIKQEDTDILFQYIPEGRRDPFKSIIVASGKRLGGENLPPLQRRELSELKLIGVVWGGFGFGAIIQTPDGKGYPVRKGTKIGLNAGVVARITQKDLTVVEKYLDIFGENQVREVVMELHPQKEGLE
ncbi:MAG TPA: pilus assembly protein PilP [Candidatus Manganitrophaceae bacterium]